MTAQLPLALHLPPGCTFDDFVADANPALPAQLKALARGETEQLYLHGPAGSGKSHLLLATLDHARGLGREGLYLPLAELADQPPALLEGLESYPLLACDDLQAVAGRREWEEALFHLYNRARGAGAHLLFAADRPPGALPLSLPDLGSRLAWGAVHALQPLDDAGRQELLQRHARRLGLELHPAAARWMVTRCSRDPRQLTALLQRLDRAALAAGRRLTLPFVREQLG